MKHIKKFNENALSDDDLHNLQVAVRKSIFTPPTEKIRINKIYLYVIIQLDGGKWATIDMNCNFEFWNTRFETIDNIDDDTTGFDQYVESWDDFLRDFSPVVILDFNPINFQEIEDVMQGFGLNIQNIWAVEQ